MNGLRVYWLWKHSDWLRPFWEWLAWRRGYGHSIALGRAADELEKLVSTPVQATSAPAVELSAPVAAVKVAAHIGRERASGRYYLVVAGSFRKIMSGFETPEAAAQWTEGTEYVVVSGPKSVR